MNRNEAISIATAKHREVCDAEWSFWTNGGVEPSRADYGFIHGWFKIGEFSIGPHEYAPGPTYNID